MEQRRDAATKMATFIEVSEAKVTKETVQKKVLK